MLARTEQRHLTQFGNDQVVHLQREIDHRCNVTAKQQKKYRYPIQNVRFLQPAIRMSSLPEASNEILLQKEDFITSIYSVARKAMRLEHGSYR